MRIAGLVAIVALLSAGCSTVDTRSVYHPARSLGAGDRVLVVGVEHDTHNRPTVEALARQLAFAIAQRGRAAVDLAALADSLDVHERPLPAALLDRLARGALDTDIAVRLGDEGVRLVIFLEVQIYEQVWAAGGKRTRVGLAARGRDLADNAPVWRAYATPEVHDEPGRGFQLGTEAAVTALARIINGDPEPSPVQKLLAPVLHAR
jgi:hypothetical protein